jgi:hypothetical protein
MIQPENDTQHRNGDQPAADPEEATQRSEAQPQQQIQQQVEQIHGTSKQCAHVTECWLARKRTAAHNGFADSA